MSYRVFFALIDLNYDGMNFFQGYINDISVLLRIMPCNIISSINESTIFSVHKAEYKELFK